MSTRESMIIDDVEYVRKDSIKEAPKMSGDYVIVRADRAGVFAGYLDKRKGSEVVLKKARRIWFWKGASSLSELAMRGSSNINDCKFPCPVARITILGVIEVISCSELARTQIEGASEWTMH